MPYRSLNAEKILATIHKLQMRVDERFPSSSLSRVCNELSDVGRNIEADVAQLRTPIWWVWSIIALAVLGAAAVFFWFGTFLSFDQLADGPLQDVEGIESTLNTIIIVGVGFLAITSLEKRIKRSRAIQALSPLRSITHVIDMHQLTKDPSAISKDVKRTKSSPDHMMKPAELLRYLDYCSELLALTGKLAALYAQSVDDPEVVSAVNDMEMLTTNLSRKIWQKIMVIET